MQDVACELETAREVRHLFAGLMVFCNTYILKGAMSEYFETIPLLT